MASKTSTTAFFGDGEHQFTLTPELIEELERSTGAGIGTLSRRIASRDFRHKDIVEVVRLGLIGGGMTPQRAAELVSTYTAVTPLLELWNIAAGIVTTLMAGPDKSENENADAG
jgi:hypothetical protein